MGAVFIILYVIILTVASCVVVHKAKDKSKQTMMLGYAAGVLASAWVNFIITVIRHAF